MMNELLTYEDVPCRYFEKAGPRNTKKVLEAVSKRAEALSISKVLVASVSGSTAFEALEILNPGIQIIVVTHVTGFREPNTQSFPEEARKELEEKGIQVLTAQHAFGGLGRAVRNKLSTFQVDEIMAFTLRTFGHGTKVAIELTLMAADAGLVRTDEDVISVGGSGKGADTALVIKPANTHHFFDLRVRQIICKPTEF
jgi:hypothetical protein